MNTEKTPEQDVQRKQLTPLLNDYVKLLPNKPYSELVEFWSDNEAFIATTEMDGTGMHHPDMRKFNAQSDALREALKTEFDLVVEPSFWESRDQRDIESAYDRGVISPTPITIHLYKQPHIEKSLQKLQEKVEALKTLKELDERVDALGSL